MLEFKNTTVSLQNGGMSAPFSLVVEGETLLPYVELMVLGKVLCCVLFLGWSLYLKALSLLMGNL